jgi:hypothetical protein
MLAVLVAAFNNPDCFYLYDMSPAAENIIKKLEVRKNLPWLRNEFI